MAISETPYCRSISSESVLNRRIHRKLNLSFAGCGFLGIYHVGVAVCFKKYAPQLLLNRISGASAGGIAACFLLCDLPVSTITCDVLNLVCMARKRILGPFSPNFNVQEVLAEGLRKHLPDDAHIRVSGKLHISLTRLPGFKNVIVSKFYSKEDLIQALLASAFVPFFSGSHPPKFHGVYYMDGGFSNNLVTLDENTITVSPFCGETDICPRDPSSQLFHVNLANTSIEVSKQNVFRFARILYPPKPEVLTKLCMQGFHDSLRFLQSNNLIKCAQYIAIESTIHRSMGAVEEEEEHDPECVDCMLQREEAMTATLPDNVKRLFQEATDATSKGMINWLYHSRGVKVLSLMMLPYTLPFEIAYAACSKLFMPHSLLMMCEFIMDQLEHVLCMKSETPNDCVACTCHLNNSGFCVGFKEERVSDITLNTKSGETSVDKQNPSAEIIKSHEESMENEDDKDTFEKKLSFCETFADDTFENVLAVTEHHNALLTFYYLDDHDKVKVAEIYEVTGDEAVKLIDEPTIDLLGWMEHQEKLLKSKAEPIDMEEEDIHCSDAGSSDISHLMPESDQRSCQSRKSSKSRN